MNNRDEIINGITNAIETLKAVNSKMIDDPNIPDKFRYKVLDAIIATDKTRSSSIALIIE